MNHAEYNPDLSSHGIVALVRNQEDKFLLLEDSRSGDMYGRWAPPHGRCEPDDIDEASAVVREVVEEVGLSVRPLRKVLTQAADTKVKTVSFWLVDVASPDAEIILDESESLAYGWFSLEQSLQLELYPGTRAFFMKVLSGDIILG